MLAIVWLLSGQLDREPAPPLLTLAEQADKRSAQRADAARTRVRTRLIHASPQVRHLRVRGKTQNKRTVTILSEARGALVERPVERGSSVAEGDLLCRISIEDREATRLEAQEALNQARLEYEGALELEKDGYLSETGVAQARARKAAAAAALTRSQLALDRTRITAPFAGVVETVHQEVGDYLVSEKPCVTLVDLDPMLLTGQVPEREVGKLAVGDPAIGILSDGARVEGQVSFVGQQSNAETRSYPIEIQVANPDQRLRSGITALILIPVAEVMAQRVSPALFSLDDAGVIGIRTLDNDNRVRFHPVDIVRDDVDGVWVTGLPERTTLITVGQEQVTPGELVEPEREAGPEMPASATPQAQNRASEALDA